MASKPAVEKNHKKKKTKLKEARINKTEGTDEIKKKQRLQVRKAPSKHLNLTI